MNADDVLPEAAFGAAAGADVEALLTQAMDRIRAAEDAWRQHEVANARTAIEGADAVLAAGGLSDTDRALMARLRTSGLARLDALVPGGAVGAGPVSLRQAARDAVDGVSRAGVVTLDVDRGLLAAGSPFTVTEAIRQLLACGPAPASSSTIVLRGRRADGAVELWLEPAAEATGSEGLPVRARVAARVLGTGGDVVTATHGGRRTVGIRLPAAPPSEEPA